jgi:hypothetical protein
MASIRDVTAPDGLRGQVEVINVDTTTHSTHPKRWEFSIIWRPAYRAKRCTVYAPRLKYFIMAISEAIKTNANFAHINQNVSHFVFTHVFALEKFLSWAETPNCNSILSKVSKRPNNVMFRANFLFCFESLLPSA